MSVHKKDSASLWAPRRGYKKPKLDVLGWHPDPSKLSRADRLLEWVRVAKLHYEESLALWHLSNGPAERVAFRKTKSALDMYERAKRISAAVLQGRESMDRAESWMKKDVPKMRSK